MVIDPRELDPRRRQAIPEDRVPIGTRCARCGQGLDGMALWAQCPGCGEAISERARAAWVAGVAATAAEPPKPLQRRVLVDYAGLPRASKRRLAAGLSIAALGPVLMAGGMLVAWLTLSLRGNGLVGLALADAEAIVASATLLAALPGAVLWVLGLVVVCPRVPGPPRDKADAASTATRLDGLSVGRPRWWPVAVVLSAGLWAGVFGCVLASVSAGGVGGSVGGGGGVELWAVRGAVLAALAALANGVVCWHLRDLALLLRDGDALSRMEQSALLLPLVLLFVGTFLFTPAMLREDIGVGGTVVGLFQGVMGLLAFAGFALWPVWRFVAGVWSLGACARWSVREDVDLEQRNRRFVAKSLAVEREANQRRAARGGEID
jgi:hypothetical protein